MEAEYLAISHATKHAIWMKQLLKELGYGQDTAVKINADNQSAIAFTKDSTDHSQTKHIDIRHHFVREHISNGNIQIEYIHMDQNSADIFTKALAQDKHKYITASLSLIQN